MKELNMSDLENCFKGAKEMEVNYVGVEIQMAGFEKNRANY